MSVNLSTDVRVLIQEYFKAWTEGNTETILSYFSDDVVINLLGGPALLEGKKAVTDYFVAPFLKAFPGNVHQMQNYIQVGNQVVIEWLFVAVHKGEFGGMPATGKQIKLPGCSVYTVENGHITRGHLYFNGPTLMEQLAAS